MERTRVWIGIATVCYLLLSVSTASARTLNRWWETTDTTRATESADEKPAEEPKEKSIKVSGFADIYYSLNFQQSPTAVFAGSGAATVRVENPLRNFDFRDRAFGLNLAEVMVEKAITEKSPIGFRLDIDAGPATDWVHLLEPGGSDTWRYFQQAYVSVPLFRKKGVDVNTRGTILEFGKFVTNHGYEVIESKDNPNYTRSLLFAWAIPYYHTGVRITTRYAANQYIQAHVVQGWNNVAENNGNKTYGLMWGWTPNSKWYFTQTAMIGNEPQFGSAPFSHTAASDERLLLDTVIKYNSGPKTTWGLNLDYGHQKKGDPANAVGTAQWKGIAGYLIHKLGPKSSAIIRAEAFQDRKGFIFGGTGQTVREVTATYEFRSLQNLTHRIELRHDWATSLLFGGAPGGATRGNQTTLLFGTFVTF